MAKAKKVRELEEPDEFLRLTSKALEYTRVHKTLVGGAALLILLIAVAIGVWSHHLSKYREESSISFSNALEFYRGTLAEGPKKEEIEKCVSFFERIIERYGHSPYAAFSYLYLAKCHEWLGEKQKAWDEYDEGINLLKRENPFRGVWEVSWALSSEPDKGIELLKKRLKEKSNILEPYTRFSLALLYQEKGDIKTAFQELEQLKGQFPSSPFGKEATKIAELLK